MFWFKLMGFLGTTSPKKFKYIICFGSSSRQVFNSDTEMNLNTSYVLVQASNAITQKNTARFKYIICFGSRKEYLSKDSSLNHLNTSYVLVQEKHQLLVHQCCQFKYIICFGSRYF